MSLTLDAGAAAIVSTNAVPAVVGGLEGCWNAPGVVRGQAAISIARGDWRIGHLYFMLQLRSVGPGRPYKAAIIYGADPNKAGAIYSYWLDTFGGAAPLAEISAETKDGFRIAYKYPDSVYTNQFSRAGAGWTWTIQEKQNGKPEKLFARYELSPTSCNTNDFEF